MVPIANKKNHHTKVIETFTEYTTS